MMGTGRSRTALAVLFDSLAPASVATAVNQSASRNVVAAKTAPGELARTGLGSLNGGIGQLVVAWFTVGLFLAGLIFLVHRYTTLVDRFGSTGGVAEVADSQSGQGWGIDGRSPGQHRQPDDGSSSERDSGPGATTNATSHSGDVEPDTADTGTTPQVNEKLEMADNLRDEASDYHDAEQYDPALAAYREAEETYKDALETASESERIDTGAIAQKLAAVQTERQEVRRQQLHEEIDSIRSVLGRADSLADDGELERAQERLTDLESRLTTARETAKKHDFDDIHDEIATLEERRKKRLTEVTERLKERPIPDDIPGVPTVSVDYDALTKVEPIGGGGNADVKKAAVSTPHGEVTLAIKEPRMGSTLNKDQMDRILEEAEIWNKLDDHDHIVGVVDYDSEPMPWIAMEYMDGGHLGEWTGEMSIPQALWTAIATTKGVRHAHRRGVAHLDLKPQNVLFRTVEDAWDVPKVADWGLSKHLLDHSKSVEGMSVEYAAPEQLGEDYGQTDDITDIYQLGALFYELFTGRPPFEGEPFEIIDMVKADQPAPPSEIADVPDGLDEILLRALAKEKDDRYDDIVYLRDDLQELFDEW